MSSKAKSRDSNIELLRIISIIFIIMFHYVYKSEFLYNGLTFNVFVIKSFWLFGELGVNLFILITGYYVSKSNFSLKKFILLIFEVLFYQLLLYIIGDLVGYNSDYLSLRQSIVLFLPNLTGKYWFMTAYLLVYLLSPFLNFVIKNFNKKNYQKFLLLNLIIWSIIPTIFGFLYNGTESMLFYNRLIWLIFMYFVGGYIRKYNIKILKDKTNCIKISLKTYLIMLGSIIYIYYFKDSFIKLGTNEISYLWGPNNIFMFILSVSFFKLFTNIKIKNNKIINKISSTTLGIYLLHDGYLAHYMWSNIFKSNQNIYSDNFLIHILISTFTIFVVGVIIDLIRLFIEKYTVKKLIENKIWKNIYNRLSLIYNSFINKYI